MVTQAERLFRLVLVCRLDEPLIVMASKLVSDVAEFCVDAFDRAGRPGRVERHRDELQNKR